MRVNARIGDATERKLRSLVEQTGQGISEVICSAIGAYYEQLQAKQPRPARILEATGFIGRAGGDPDLSENYKSELDASLGAKHDPD